MSLSKKSQIVLFCLLAAAALVLGIILPLQQFLLVFFVIAGILLTLALYRYLQQLKA